jgi:hypothetical protein
MGEDDKNYSQEIQDRIRELAHSMWEWAGRQQDMALHYWVAAEKEVLATMRAAADKLMPGEKLEKAEESTADAATAAPSEPPESAAAVAAAKTERAEESTTAAATAAPSEPSEAAVKPAAKTERAEKSPTPAEAVRRTQGRTRA